MLKGKVTHQTLLSLALELKYSELVNICRDRDRFSKGKAEIGDKTLNQRCLETAASDVEAVDICNTFPKKDYLYAEMNGVEGKDVIWLVPAHPEMCEFSLGMMSGPISEANFSVSSPTVEDVISKYCFQFKLQKTRRPSSPWMVGPDPWLFHRKLQHQSKINDSRSVGVNVIVGFFWDIDALAVWISLADGGIEKNTGEKKNSNSIFRTTKRPNGFMTGWNDLFDFAFLEATNKLRYRVDEAEEDRGQSKDDEDGLEVEDEDEDLRAGTKNQHGISYANSKEDSEDEWDGIWRPEPTGGKQRSQDYEEQIKLTS
ncbi:hypothetical protein C8R41DRAFT_862921 [Lentinula lateritia]|uniref:Uncharacterized protein n=1 Tax=Lentinula lateritia TaxID=40482 RepID=A0ABQ8VWU8_9AGAR|nr:hypothetical protein C8R41DRAFT_862921 [Lentinula lateritia]